MKPRKPSKPALRVFLDIIALDDLHVQALLREVEGTDLCLALQDAAEALQAKIFRNMSERAAEMIREDMHYMGPVKPAHVAAARAKMLKVASCLQKAGWRAKPRPPRKPSELAAKLVRDLAEKPAAARPAAEMVPLLKGMAELARREGILVLEQDGVLGALDDEFAKLGLQLVVDGTDPVVIKEVLELRKKALLTEAGRRLDVIATGLVAIQLGTNPRLVEAKCRACLP